MTRRRTTEHVRVYSPHEIALPVCQSSSSGGEVHKILTERKCWRVAKDKAEVVWPPHLEAALIEGLEKYEPRESRSARAFGRFPNRNKFVSNHILNVTGRWRTPKQVGSRIQQLRDTDTGKSLLKKLSDRHYEMMCAKGPSERNECRSEEPDLLDSPLSNASTPLMTQSNQVVIDVLPPDAVYPYSDYSSYEFGLNPSTTTGIFHSGPRPLRAIDPTVTFSSPIPMSAYSSFRVFQGEQLVHVENTRLEPQQSEGCRGTDMTLYSTTLVPQLWNTLCASSDPSSYTILQEIVRIPDSAMHVQGSDAVVLSVVYQFSQKSCVDEDYASASASDSGSSTHELYLGLDDLSFCTSSERASNNPIGYALEMGVATFNNPREVTTPPEVNVSRYDSGSSVPYIGSYPSDFCKFTL